jgi:hypothetical protein
VPLDKISVKHQASGRWTQAARGKAKEGKQGKARQPADFRGAHSRDATSAEKREVPNREVQQGRRDVQMKLESCFILDELQVCVWREARYGERGLAADLFVALRTITSGAHTCHCGHKGQ